MIVDVVASQPHYIDHLAPVWMALEPEERGTFTVPPNLEPLARWYGIEDGATSGATVYLAAGSNDMCDPRRARTMALMEHGVGQTYVGAKNKNFAGGNGRHDVDVFLCPNERVRAINAKRNPRALSVVVGSPRMDQYFTRDDNPPPIPAVSFHWESDVCSETMSGFQHFHSGVKDLANHRFIVGHAHPRWGDKLYRWFTAHGIAYAHHFHNVITRCGVYVCDNSSTLYEFAALDRPVVVMNPPWYREQVEHGLRFWEYADVGVQVYNPDLLAAAVETALEDDVRRRDRRREITGELFPVRDGTSASRVAEVLRGLP